MSNQDLYGILGIPKDSDQKDIKRAYYEMAKKHHPDKGGDKEKFQGIQKAFDILSDDGKRQLYDMTGRTEEGGGGGGGAPQGNPFGPGGPFGGGGGGFPFNINSMFGGMFGGGPPPVRQKQPRRPKGPNKTHEIGLSLEDYYIGRFLRIEFDRQVFCEPCKGKGSKTVTTCGECNGEGIKEVHLMMGPGMVMVQKGPCSACKGEGQIKGPVCGECSGSGLVAKHKTLEIHIEPGARPGDVIEFPRECSDHPDFDEAGDVHIILLEADESSIFKRDGDTLSTTVILSLMESLVGCERTLSGHPGFKDGLKVEFYAGVHNMEVCSFSGKGMTKKGSAGGVEKGDLRVTVHVIKTAEEIRLLSERGDAVRSIFTS